MTNLVTLVMPHGPQGQHTVDLDALTAKAAALAEALAEDMYRWIRTRSTKPMRDMYHPGHAELMVGPDSPDLDRPILGTFESWEKVPDDSAEDVHRILEREARKLGHWYPVARDGSDLPHSRAAANDDGLTRGQVFDLLRRRRSCAGITPDEWMRNSTRGLNGFPRPVRHNGQVSLWSRKDVEDFIAGRAVIDQLAHELASARKGVDAAMGDLRRTLVPQLEAGQLTEVYAAALAGVDRMTVRSWLGK
jgi:hypothetical protein